MANNLKIRFSDGTVIDNNSIVSESMNINTTLSDDMSLMFGQCSSTEFSVQVMASVGSHVGEKIVVTIEDGDTEKKIGEFYVFSDKKTDDRLCREIIAYDSLYKVLEESSVNWFNQLEFPMTVKQFRDSFFTYYKIEQVPVNLPNDTMQIENVVLATALSGRDVITSICELNACFGHINEEGKFEYIFITKPTEYDEEHSFDANDYDLSGLTYEDWQTNPISKVTFRNNYQDADAPYTEGTYGTGNNLYLIQDNLLLYGKNSTQLTAVAETFYNLVKDITYTPTEIHFRGKDDLKLGDYIKVQGNYDTIEFPILTKQTGGIVLLRHSVIANGMQDYADASTDVQRNLKLIQKLALESASSVGVIKGELAQFETLVTDQFSAVDADITDLRAQTITTDRLSAEVAKIDNLTVNDAFIKNIQATAVSADYIEGIVGKFDYVTTDELHAHYVTADEIEATYGHIISIDVEVGGIHTLYVGQEAVDYITANYADLRLANIDTANIDKAKIADLFAELALISNATIKDGHITGTLDSVEINADRINSGTLVADRILLRGEGEEDGRSLLYLLNYNKDKQEISVDTLDGDVITDRTVTADKLVANSITANEISSGAITSEKIRAGAITAEHMSVGAITTDKIAFQDKTLTEQLGSMVEESAEIQKMVDGIGMIVNRNVEDGQTYISSGTTDLHPIEDYIVFEIPTLYNYPANPDFYNWRTIGSFTVGTDVVLSPHRYEDFLGKIAKYQIEDDKQVIKYYYQFSKEDDNYYWRRMSNAEVDVLADKSASILLTEDGITMKVSYEDEEESLTLTREGLKATKLYCC